MRRGGSHILFIHDSGKQKVSTAKTRTHISRLTNKGPCGGNSGLSLTRAPQGGTQSGNNWKRIPEQKQMKLLRGKKPGDWDLFKIPPSALGRGANLADLFSEIYVHYLAISPRLLCISAHGVYPELRRYPTAGIFCQRPRVESRWNPVSDILQDQWRHRTGIPSLHSDWTVSKKLISTSKLV